MGSRGGTGEVNKELRRKGDTLLGAVYGNPGRCRGSLMQGLQISESVKYGIQRQVCLG